MIFYFLSSLVFSAIAAVLHFLYCVFTRRREFSSGIRRLMYHGKITLWIWAMLLPFAIFSGALMMSNFSDSKLYVSLNVKIFPLLLGGAVFWAFFFVYLTFYYILDRSVSSRMMMAIERSPGKELTLEQLKGIYGPDGKYKMNIDGMVSGRFIKDNGDGTFSCTAKGAFVAYCSLFVKNSLKLGPGG